MHDSRQCVTCRRLRSLVISGMVLVLSSKMDLLASVQWKGPYDLVVIGTPVWAWSVSPPVRSYLAANKGRLPDVAFFCTMGSRGGERAFEEMQAIAGKAPRAGCAVTAREAASEAYRTHIAQFMEQLKTLTS